jgi:hypothetical protein
VRRWAAALLERGEAGAGPTAENTEE